MNRKFPIWYLQEIKLQDFQNSHEENSKLQDFQILLEENPGRRIFIIHLKKIQSIISKT
jgi:hypothetical protein